MQPKISVIVICHNDFDSLLILLESISQSTMDEFEVVLVFNEPKYFKKFEKLLIKNL